MHGKETHDVNLSTNKLEKPDEYFLSKTANTAIFSQAFEKTCFLTEPLQRLL
jgi:hypothetical protein